jgi:hypothetical protein
LRGSEGIVLWLISGEEMESSMKSSVRDVVVAQLETKMKHERRIVGMNGRY